MLRLMRLAWRHIGLVLELLGYALWFALDVAAAGTVNGAGLSVIAGLIVPGLVLLRRRSGMSLTLVAAMALTASLIFSAVSLVGQVLDPLPDGVVDLSFAEDLALAILVIHVLRKLPLNRALVVSGIAAIAIVATAAARVSYHASQSSLATLCALGWGGSVAIGLVLRELATRRRAALDDARSGERMELARELHDVVAHQVTGIVVAAQAAAVVARTSPDDVDRALAAIETAGTEALAAMRRMVGVLRGQESEGARTPGAELADLPTLVDRFDPEERLVKLTTDPGLEHAVLPAGVAVTGYRIVQEALTNVRRHAPDATAVEIDLRVREGALLVTVRNDGSGSRQAPLGGVGGFGLAGMAERAAALDGELTAGPAGNGVWLVAARLPLRGTA